MTILIGRYAGGTLISCTSTETGDRAYMSAAEWASFVHRVKSGHLDHIAALPKGETVPADTEAWLIAQIGGER